MINFFKDFFIFFKIQKKENQKKICFFNESEFTYQYLQPYIEKKSKRKKLLIVSFCNLKIKNNNINIFELKTNLFRQLYFLTAKNKLIYSSTPDLNNSIFRTSKIQKNRYIYLQHSSVGLVKAYNEKAFLFFDAIQATNKFQFSDVDYINKTYNKKIRKFKSRYKLFEKINLQSDSEKEYDLMIAPTWSTKFYNEDFYKLVKKFKNLNMKILLRPHPMSLYKNELDIELIKKIGIDFDQSKFPNFSKIKNLISDYSGIFIEFMITKKRKPILINTMEKNLSKIHVNRTTFEGYVRDNFSVQTSFRDLLESNLNILKSEKKLSLNETKFFENFY